MVFSSLSFLFFFLPVCLLIYYLVPKSAKNAVLFVSGLLFYAWGEPIYVLFMLLCITVNYVAGLLIARYEGQQKKRFAAMLGSVIFSLGLLVVCKYSGMLTSAVGLHIKTLPLPIGISFYTFQSMSYTIDLYRKQIGVQRSYINFGAYVAMFPQIIAGPIVRYADVEKQLQERSVTLEGFGEGAGIFICGLAKKAILANSIGALWTQMKATEYGDLSVLGAWIGILAFTFQIYFDFSGYSDMAVGLGKMLGFTFPENFRYPYGAQSVGDFWRRWHITLSTWFREYVYIPLGGNRCSKLKQVRNLLVVWGLTGLWHGASWNFLLWGLYFGVLLILERFVLKRVLEQLPPLVRWAYTFLLVVFGWILFDTDTISGAGQYFLALFGGGGALADANAKYLFWSYLPVFLCCIVASTKLGSWISGRYAAGKRGSLLYYSVLPVVQMGVFLLCIAYLVNATYNPFLYFRF